MGIVGNVVWAQGILRVVLQALLVWGLQIQSYIFQSVGMIGVPKCSFSGHCRSELNLGMWSLTVKLGPFV